MSLKLAVLASGRGSNLEAIIKAIKNKTLDAAIEVVLTNNSQAKALDIAKLAGIKAIAIDSHKMDRAAHESLLLKELSNYQIDFVVLAGYMRVLTPPFLKAFHDPAGFYRVINIHPSLLPAFPGKNAYEEAFVAGVKTSGITIHLVDDQVDHGPILAQEQFNRLDNDTLETFQARGLAIEHILYPTVLQNIAKYGINALLAKPIQKVASL